MCKITITAHSLNMTSIAIDIEVEYIFITECPRYTYHWRRKRGGKGGICPPTFLIGGGGQWYVCAPPLLTPHFYFPLELYVYITLTNNYLAFFIYQLIILWTISINWHRWLLLNNHTSKYNSFILVLYRSYKNHVSVCPPPPPPPPLFGTLLRHCICSCLVYTDILLQSSRFSSIHTTHNKVRDQFMQLNS